MASLFTVSLALTALWLALLYAEFLIPFHYVLTSIILQFYSLALSIGNIGQYSISASF